MGIDSDLNQCIKNFLAINDEFSSVSKLINSKVKSKTNDENEKNRRLFYYLAQEMFLNPANFDEIFANFSKHLPHLLQVALFSSKKESNEHTQHILKTILLGRIVVKRKDLQGYALKYFTSNPLTLENLDSTESSSKKPKMEKLYTDLHFVEACYHLLKSNPSFYRNKWSWSTFIEKYLDHEDNKIKWFSCQISAILFGMCEKQTKKLILNHISVELDTEYCCIFNLKGTLIDSTTSTGTSNPIWTLPTGDINDLLNISGIYVPILSKQSNIVTNLVEVPSTVNNLRKVALGLTLNKAICLQGPVGSGKTSLVEYFAEKTGRNLGENFIKVQLGDQTDSKMLLGTYRCTDIPGEFVWQPGVLTQAVLEGNWLLLEDIDSASMDIASMLTSLLENNSLTVPGYRDSVPVNPGFQLFVTQRFVSTISGHHKKHSNAMSLLEKHLLQINVDPLTKDELKQIVETKYPQFRTISDRLVNAFLLFNQDTSDTSKISIPKSGRLISTRDFFKWCSRAIQGFDVKSQESALKVLQDAIDVFCCSYSDQKDALDLAKQISTNLGIVNHKAEYFFKDYKPTMQLTADHLIAGRVVLRRDNNELMKHVNFSFTRPSSVLLERIMCCINLQEPVLLVGETGTGKTSCVQYLAHTIGQKLIVINMNQQSDSADLLGGFKPVDLKYIIAPIRREFEQVFSDFFKVEPNRKYLSNLALCFNNQRWSDLVKLMTVSYQAAERRLKKSLQDFEQLTGKIAQERIDKRNKDKVFLDRWLVVGEKLQKLDIQLKHTSALAFAFIEGSLVKAVEHGYWVLLDEINLANAETLECLSGLLEGSQGSLCLLERGDKKPVKRHLNFTLFACMNPSTDVGKKDLPAGLRNRFTEFFVEELNEKNDLLLLVNNYLEAMSLKPKDLEAIVNFYLKVRRETILSLSDGLGHKPHYSLRSLCRALIIASKNPCGIFKKSLHEAFCLSFLTQLDSNSYSIVEKLISSCLIGDAKAIKAVLNQPIPEPDSRQEQFIQFEGYWVKKGQLDPSVPEDYILTASVRKNLKDLVRVVSIGRLPVLLQGDTSVGKTSLITYLAKSSGNKCVRINNHEHTDLQEYIGSYVADLDGKLVFREGLLVEAMRKGHWIILDELNLAPTDVLEALNRVLDDNRELFIPETQEIVKADQNFMLFATQNPPGAYGGRKMLSRAFRNRFVELHFNEIPPKELEFILHQRCQMAPSYAKKMINVMTDLQTRRRGSAAFAGKQGFITLRDLFRWGERYRLAQNSKKLYDWDQHLADEGYLVLAGKVRRSEEKCEIIEVLQKHLKREVDPDRLFTLSDRTSTVTQHILKKIEENKSRYKNIVWTYNMRQLAVLVSKALDFKEPVLLVGETGGGKTTVCKLIAENNGQNLVTVNCHMHTESSDFIGGLRPVRDHSNEESTRLFEWVDGPLITAMVQGNVFLADEISLADDSVLERLNSLLEPERTLLLAEKGIDINNKENSELVVAHQNFFFIGTMNPGGDFGKKELSPALRNRFTEIWCDSCRNREDLVSIIEQNVKPGLLMGDQEDDSSGIGNAIMDFLEWFEITDVGKRFTISIRDVLTWVNFINTCSDKMELAEAYVHGAYLTFLDSLGSGITSTESLKSLENFKSKCLQFLSTQAIQTTSQTTSVDLSNLQVESIAGKFGIKPFYIETNPEVATTTGFTFNAPTTLYNTLRLLRGMQLNKAILLEGSPGVGKTSLVTALAKFTGHKLFRINLSDQTDISDLFGADLPVEGGTGGQFSWKDGPLLQALKDGSWILLDELNLASQSVLEGLNACLDHRGEIFIPELGKTFYVKPGTRFFGCQNPLKQGGSRRGLPQSFLNRFIQVYVNSLTDKDLHFILTNQFKNISADLLLNMVEFNSRMVQQLESHTFGHKGAPWECNLRDITRWCEATIYRHNVSDTYHPQNVVSLIYSDRMRTLADKNKVQEICSEVFGCKVGGTGPVAYVTNDRVYFGDVFIERNQVHVDSNVLKQDKTCLVLRSQLDVLRSLAYCVNLNWMAILVGTTGSGKSSVVKTLASLSGKTLKTLPVTSAMDTTDILGGFEQTDYSRHLDEIARELERVCLEVNQEFLVNGKNGDALRLMQHWETYRQLSDTPSSSVEEEIKLFLRKISRLEDVAQFISSYHQESVVAALTDRLQKISFAIKNEASLNAGGKFEWVDSVLIKCLQDGSWLLVDNVNLCSSAVLDRLNALLEPNGVLTVSERGVDANGQMVEIKPHKDFRLFLTMDPRNGEISRAMRNRGIEIYLLNEGELQHSHDIDRSSLIQLEGLSSFHAEMLIKLHNFISELVIGERPNVNELIQVSTLAAQQLKYGVDSKQTFTSTILEVYYKTRSPREFSCTNFEIVISEEITKLLNGESSTVPACFDSNATLKTQEISLNSSIEKVKQQAVLLFDYLENTVKTCADVDVKLGHLLFCFYSTTSLEDISVRHSYLQAKINSIEHLTPSLQNLLLNFTNKLLYICQRSSNALSLPVDHNWIPEISTLEDTLENNTQMLPLFFSVDSLLENTNLANISGNRIEFDGKKLKFNKPKKGSKLTLVEYSRYLQQGLLEDRFGDVVVNNFTNLTKTYNDFLLNIVNMTKSISNHDIIELLYMLFWKSKLVELLHFNYSADVDQKQLRKVFAELPVHYKWFYKFSVQAVSKITNLPVLESLEDILKQINSKLDKQFSVMHKLGKNYQKSSNRPPPYTSKEHYDIIYKFNEISERYNSSRKGNDVLDLFNSFYGNKGLRSSLVEFKAELDYGFSNFDEKIEKIKEISNKISCKNLEPCTKFELQLVPLLDHLMHLQIRHNISTGHDMALTNNVLIPTELCGTLLLYHRTKDPRLSYELYRHYYQYLMLSPSAQPSKFLGEEEEKEIHEFAPKITFLLSNLLINAKGVEDLGRVTLGNFRHLMKQHDVLNLTLWGNLYQLSEEEYSFMYCEKQNITKVYTKFLQELALSLKITTENKSDDTINILVQNILKKLRDVHSSDAHPELTALLDKIKYSFLKFEQLQKVLELDQFLLTVSCLYQSVSYLKAKFNSKLSSIDPLAKKTLKRNYCAEAMRMFDVLRLCYDSLNQIYSDKKETVHDYCKQIEVLQTKLQSKHRELSKYVAYRPDDVLYSSVAEVISYAFSTLLADDYIVEVNEATRQQVIRERSNKVPSYENLIHELSQYRSSFPDIIEPLLSNISEYLYGFKLYLSVLKMQDEKQKQSNAMVSTNDFISLVKFPSISQDSEHDLIKMNKSVKFFLDATEESDTQEQENFRLLKCSIVESVNTSISNSLPCEILRKHDFFQFSKLLDTFIGAYNKQQEQMEIKKQEEESLYKIKTNQNDKSEEEQIQEDLNTLFPNYYTIDFADFQKDASIDDTTLENKVEAKYEEVISYNDLKDIIHLHVDLLTCMTKNEWLNPTKTKKLVPDYILPLLEKFKTFSKILEKVMDSVDYRMDEDLIASLNVLLAVKKRYGNTDDIFQKTSSQKRNDFYKDSNVEEVKSCYHVLEDLKIKINELLEEWPDQPTLNTILTVIDRIYKFEITSPISRYLTGFEILLTKCHEWEEVAHSGVSISQHTQNLTNQIVTWRKLELAVWKDLLSKVHDRLNEPLPKWWLHLYNVMHQFIQERKFGEKELVETLQTFITKSNMAEFQGRLNLLYAFHCHATYLEHTEETESFINILWNVYSYFRQFVDVVAKKIKDLKSPIEKKLKDYVKIVRWKDINYWAIKDTVEKSHKNIHKFMREYQAALEQPVSPCIHNIDPESSSQKVGIWDKPKNGKSPDFYSHYLTSEIDNYLSDQQEIQHSIESASGSAKRLLDKATKVRELSRQIILATTYPALIQDLDVFVTEVIETSSHLQKLEVDTTLTKEKQKSQAKNILQRKHRALADLFKSLTKMGLSFKTGIVDSKVKDPTAEFLIKPIDLESQFRNEYYGYKEDRILSFWESSEKYYVRSLMRFDVLETALQSPSKELGMQNVERVKGFSQDMLTSIQHQKNKLVEASRVYYYIRHYARQLKQFSNAKEYLPCNLIDSITALLSKINSTMSHYQIVLNTCPIENSFNSENVEILILKTDLENRIVYKHDKYWSKATTIISDIQSSCKKLISQLFKAKAEITTSDFQFLKNQYVSIMNLSELTKNLSNVQAEILSLKAIFGNTKLINNLLVLADEVRQATSNLQNPVLTKTSIDGDISTKCEKEIKKLSKKILSTVIDLHKKYEAVPKPKDDAEENVESIQEDHLTKYLVDNLSTDISQLNMQGILEEINQIASYIMGASLENIDKRKALAGQVCHVLDQAILLQRYFFTQQVAVYRVSCKMASVLLNVFIELASKGFCIPPEFSDEFDKEGISKPSDGLGLGEGQGERDVSDKIESEDQLDDAQPAGQEKDNEEDKDCKEEEKGIEMSEDFDSKLQDKEKKDDDDSNSESGDSDADEQMGETEKGAEQQNTETFGDDKEEGDGEEEEGPEQKEEKGEKGEKEGEEQLGAKEGKTANDEEDQKEGKEEKEKNKKEINEMEEPEYDDDQIDPHHGQQQELPEPEPMDLPEDMQLDDGEAKDEENDDKQDENPFDIDTMKTDEKPDDKNDEAADENKDDESKRDDEKDFSSDDEDVERGDKKDGEEGADGEDDENKDDDDVKESEKADKEDDANSENGDESALDQTESHQENIEAMEIDDADAADKAQASKSENQQSNQPIDELQQEDQRDQEGVGQSQMEETSSGHTAQTSAPQEIKTAKDNRDKEEQKRKQKPGESDSKRSLGDVDQPVRKKLKTVEAKNDSKQDKEDKRDEDADMYQHIEDAEKSKTQVLDVATKEQAENQKKETHHEEEKDEDPAESSKDLPEEEDTDVIDADTAESEVAEKLGETKDQKSKKQQHPQGDVLEEVQEIEIEGELVQTSTVPRSTESTHHTQYSSIAETTASRLSMEEINSLRLDVEKQLSGWNDPPSTIEADQAWQKISSVTSSLAQDLSEQLRLVLEPTQASRLRGDFRTGRRINMRKVIPYIASQFRKDKIWLRRTKPSKREYQIVLAIDDSSSMNDNHSKELAFESVALISKALTLLESGQLSVLSFGENVEVIHKLTDQFTDRSGIKLLQKFKFDQNKTCVAKLVDFSTEMFNQSQLQSTALNAKLLVIVSDGRGVFSEGETFVKQAVRRGKLSNIFMVFVIIDNPENKNSVLDIRMPVFKDGKLQEIQNYMDVFPFSFYIILRDINSLPSVLSDALRQWFEIVSNLDK